MYLRFSKTQSAYFAGFIDGDGSVYVRLKPNPTYRYGFQVAPYIALFQSAKDSRNFHILCNRLGLGRMRTRKDGILEYVIGRRENILALIGFIEPYTVLKKKQLRLMRQILKAKETIANEKEFKKLATLVDHFRELNYSKKRIKRVLTP